jgi:ABC-type uncharacterized transport system substrate-binding protein
MATTKATAEFFRMDKSGLMQRTIRQSSLLLLLMFVSGCSILLPEPPPPVVTTVPEPEPEPAITPQPTVAAEPAIEPPPPPPPPPVQQPIAPLVAVVISDRASAYVDVADALGEYLEEYEVYDLGDQSLSAKDAFAAIAESSALAVVAIGLPAAKAAQKFSTKPVVFSQVFNFNDYDFIADDMKGVAVLPPINLQMEAWRELDPSIRNVGAILGAGHEQLIQETNDALQKQGVKFHYAVAGSDRETLYLFNRLIRDLDGYILFPDNRILSRAVLEEMMKYAARHRVQVAVFNESLLERGAIFSASAVPTDIAMQIAHALEQFIDGTGGTLPDISSLSELKVDTNPVMLDKFGLKVDLADAGTSVADVQ